MPTAALTIFQLGFDSRWDHQGKPYRLRQLHDGRVADPVATAEATCAPPSASFRASHRGPLFAESPLLHASPLHSAEYASIKKDYDAISRAHFPKSWVSLWCSVTADGIQAKRR